MPQPKSQSDKSQDSTKSQNQSCNQSHKKHNNTGADSLIRTLYECLGVDAIFGYPGGAILPIYDSLMRDGRIRHYLSRHEQASGYSAEGYARSTGKVGVIFATSGPGATNTVTALADAFLDSVPVVCITGQVPSHLIGTDAFQEADIIGITRSCTKYNYLIRDAKDIPRIIQEAFYIASTGRPGPVLVDIPKDIQNQEIEFLPEPYLPRKSIASNEIPTLKEQESKLYEVIQAIKTAKRPVLYIGGGAINSRNQNVETSIKTFIEKTNMPATSTLMGLGSVSTENKNFLGMLGMHGSIEANMAMYECDLLLCLGARFDDRVTGNTKKFSPSSVKIHIDIDRSSINKIIKVDHGIIADAGDAIEYIVSNLDNFSAPPTHPASSKEDQPASSPPNLTDWWSQINKWRETKSFSFTNSADDNVIKPQLALQTLNQAIKDSDPIITTDVGQHQMWTAQYMTFKTKRRLLTSGGLGSMGYGLPAAIGAQVANPNSLVCCISGDASILMNIQELSTISQYNLPIKLFILNNSYMGMVKQWQDLFYENRYSNSYTASLPDFAKLAESFGIKGITINKQNKLESSIKEALQHEGPVVTNCIVCDKEHVYPMIKAGEGHNQLILNKEESQ